jgi:hypothetical protein
MTNLKSATTFALTTALVYGVWDSTVHGDHPLHVPVGVTLTANSSPVGMSSTTHDWHYEVVDKAPEVKVALEPKRKA